MLQGEFETLTGFLPDVLLYEAAEQEYNNGDWASKAEFCDCFKADEDGIATKCQKTANERWFEMEKQRGELIAANENLRNEIAGLADRVDELNDEIGELPKGVTEEQIRAAMQMAQQDAAHDDCTGDQILHMVWGFEYLMRRLGAE